MCGILALFGEDTETPSYLLTHRGPDDYASKKVGRCRMDFYRLAINDLTPTGMQPFIRGRKMLVCNGEIYNHKQFRYYELEGTSDCEILIPVIDSFGIHDAVKHHINGDFALVYTDGKRVMAARDPYGVRPMFYTRYDEGSIAFASEAKALLWLNSEIHIFPPGHIYDSYVDTFVCYHSTYWSVNKYLTHNYHRAVRQTLEHAIHDRLETTERDIGFLLSGGLDSSLIASIAARKMGTIKTFSIGLKGSPDLLAARGVAEYLKSDHTEVTFTASEGISHINDVIHSLESYDTTTVRASTPMWLLCKYIKENSSCRYIFSGEGSDEVLGGYLYFHKAPNVDAFACENMRRLRLIHQFDGLRADRCAGAHGLDLIVPFLDKEFVEVCMTMNQRLKIDPVEKRVLREAFEGYLPDEALLRRKDGMSDAVGTDWVAQIKAYAEKDVSDDQFREIKAKCRHHNVPLTKEEALYRSTFWKMYGKDNDHLISEIWRPKWTAVKDPSARLLIE